MLSGEAATGKFPCEAVMAEASATREAWDGWESLAGEAETVKHRLQKACPYVADWPARVHPFSSSVSSTV